MVSSSVRKQGGEGVGELPLRKFGLMFVAVFAIVAVWLRAHSWALVAFPALAVATLVITFARPSLLAGPTRLWMKLAEVLHRIVSPIVLGVMYLVLFVPFGFARRLFGGDPLERRYDAELRSYWKKCEPRTRTLDDFRQQF